MSRIAIISILCVLFSLKTIAQLKLQGKVLDAHNMPVELATVKLETLNRISMTNDSGAFIFHLPSTVKNGDRLTLIISKDGYKATKQQVIISGSPLTIILDDSAVTKTAQIAPKRKVMDTGFFQNKAFTVQHIDTAHRRQLANKDDISSLYYLLPADKTKRITIICIKDDDEALHFATAIHDLLILNGYKNVGDISVSQFTHPATGQVIDSDATGVKIIIGHKPVDI